MNPRDLLAKYWESHQECEVCGKQATEVHHIFRKDTNELKTNPLNFVSLCHDCHIKAHFTNVQEMAEVIFEVKIYDNQGFIEFADKIAHKTWAGSPFSIGLGAGASSNPALQKITEAK